MWMSCMRWRCRSGSSGSEGRGGDEGRKRRDVLVYNLEMRNIWTMGQRYR